MATEAEYQDKQRLVVVPAVYLFLRRSKDRRILFMLRYDTGYMDGYFDVPSGHLEETDSGPIDAIIRETKEETGVTVSERYLDFTHLSYRPKHDETGYRLDMFFSTDWCEGEPAIMEPDKCRELIWAFPHELREQGRKVVPHVEQGWIHSQNNKLVSQIHLSWLKENGLYKL